MIEDKAPKKNLWVKRWLIVVLVSAALFLYTRFVMHSRSLDFAYELGQGIGTSLLLHLVLRKRAVGSAGWGGFLLMLLASVLGTLMAVESRRTDQQFFVSEMKGVIKQIEGAGTQEVYTKPLSTGSIAEPQSQMGKMTTLIKKSVDESLHLQADYDRALDEIGGEKIFDVDRLRQDQHMVESRKKINQLKALVEKYRQLNIDKLNRGTQLIQTADLSEQTKTEMLVGFNKTYQTHMNQLVGVWDLEAQAVFEMEKLIDLLNSSRWSVKDQKIVFNEPDSANRFNKYLSSMNEIAAKQEAIRKAFIDNMTTRIDNLAK
jgi:hypothetical protein